SDSTRWPGEVLPRGAIRLAGLDANKSLVIGTLLELELGIRGPLLDLLDTVEEPHWIDFCPHGMGMVGGWRCRSRRGSTGRSRNQATNFANCFTASSYASRPFSALASSASPRTPASE